MYRANWPTLCLTAIIVFGIATLHLTGCSQEQKSEESTPVVELPDGYWGLAKSQPILDKTIRIRLEADQSLLSDGEREAIPYLIQAGEIMQRLYENSKHPQALEAHAALLELDANMGSPQVTQNLIDLYRLYKGPVGRNLDSEVLPFLPVEPREPGRNVYPWAISKEDVELFIAENPGTEEDILAVRTIVRRAVPDQLSADLATLQAHPILAELHPDLKNELELLSNGSGESTLYAAPYGVAYAEELLQAQSYLNEAAAVIEADDAAFAKYLRQRGEDFLTGDYEKGDALWVTSKFGNLNAQIGSYETYDDQLFGVKSFFSFVVLVEDPAMTSTINTVVSWLQEMEDLLPYETHKKVRDDIPIGAYNVLADFGQSRGTNTATILPNEAYITRKYGRIIMLRYNILTNPDLFKIRKTSFDAAIVDKFHGEYTPKGDFFRTLWHEIGHYLGVDETRDGRTLDIALEEDSAILEEMKSDLVSLFLCKRLFKKGYYSRPRLRSVQAAGIRRVLRKNQPKKTQAYATMQLMQMNYFLEKGLLTYDSETNKLTIHHGLYHDTVESMLREVLALQYEGNKEAADDYIEKYSTWDEDVHGRIAAAMKAVEQYRYAIVYYTALGE